MATLTAPLSSWNPNNWLKPASSASGQAAWDATTGKTPQDPNSPASKALQGWASQYGWAPATPPAPTVQAPANKPPDPVYATAPNQTGLDFSKPGAGEQWWTGNASQYQTPWYQEQAYPQLSDSVAGSHALKSWASQYGTQGYNTPGAGEGYVGGMLQNSAQPTTTNYAGQTFQDFKGQPYQASNVSLGAYLNSMVAQPELSANMDPYYDNAQRQALEGIDSAAAARGMYGSSFAADQGREAITNLRADQAKAEADYGLKRAAELRGWNQMFGEQAAGADLSSRGALEEARNWQALRGDLAASADKSSLGAGQLALDWNKGMGGLAIDADKNRLERLQAGQKLSENLDQAYIDKAKTIMGLADSADTAKQARLAGGMLGATNAQNLQRTRGQDAWNQQMGLSGALSNMLGQGYDQMLNGDQELLSEYLNLMLGQSKGQADTAQNANEMSKANAADWTKLLGSLGAAL